MEYIDKIWNRDIAHHPLNWIIVLCVVILSCFVIDAMHTLSGAPKPVTAMRYRRVREDEPPPENVAVTQPDTSGTTTYSPDGLPT